MNSIRKKQKLSALKEETSQSPKLDIVTELSRRRIHDGLYQIFVNLDWKSIKNAALVSKDWRHAIASAGWKSQINKRTCVSQAWRDMEVMVRQTVKPDLLEKALGDQIVYSLIDENLRKLEHNWKYGIWMGKKLPIPLSTPPCLVKGLPNFSSHLFPRYRNNPAYGMNSYWNVTADSDSQITIRNRFGLNKIIKVLDIPSNEIAPRPLPSDAPCKRPLIFSIKVNNLFIAACFYYHPEVCVWDVATLDLVKVLDGMDLFDSDWMPLNNSWHHRRRV